MSLNCVCMSVVRELGEGGWWGDWTTVVSCSGQCRGSHCNGRGLAAHSINRIMTDSESEEMTMALDLSAMGLPHCREEQFSVGSSGMCIAVQSPGFAPTHTGWLSNVSSMHA